MTDIKPEKAETKRRKGLALDSMKQLEKVFRSHKLTIKTKVRIFEAYVSSILVLSNKVKCSGIERLIVKYNTSDYKEN